LFGEQGIEKNPCVSLMDGRLGPFGLRK